MEKNTSTPMPTTNEKKTRKPKKLLRRKSHPRRSQAVRPHPCRTANKPRYIKKQKHGATPTPKTTTIRMKSHPSQARWWTRPIRKRTCNQAERATRGSCRNWRPKNFLSSGIGQSRTVGLKDVRVPHTGFLARIATNYRRRRCWYASIIKKSLLVFATSV